MWLLSKLCLRTTKLIWDMILATLEYRPNVFESNRIFVVPFVAMPIALAPVWSVFILSTGSIYCGLVLVLGAIQDYIGRCKCLSCVEEVQSVHVTMDAAVADVRDGFVARGCGEQTTHDQTARQRRHPAKSLPRIF